MAPLLAIQLQQSVRAIEVSTAIRAFTPAKMAVPFRRTKNLAKQAAEFAANLNDGCAGCRRSFQGQVAAAACSMG
jgi:hypothetical protein